MKHRLLTVLALATVALAALAASAAAGGKGQLFQFRGELVGASSTSVQLQVEGGNRPALRKMLGQSQVQSFSLGSSTEILVWRKGIPTVGNVTNLDKGDWVQINVRAPKGSSLAQIEATPASIVGDHLKPGHPKLPLFLYVGTVAGALGDRWNLTFLAETERQVEEHLVSHLERLAPEDARTRAVVEAMRNDEASHRASALELGAAEMPGPLKLAMRAMAKVMTTVAYRL